MPVAAGVSLAWPGESARIPPAAAERLLLAGSNIVLDLHGDPIAARLVVFSDGNHHMALEEAVRSFLQACPDAGDVFYATLPPRLLLAALRSGVLRVGNLELSVRPHVFISPVDILDKLAAERAITGPAQPFMRSSGLALLTAKGNPRGIRSLPDVFRPGVRLAISNPVTEAASFNLYESALLSLCPVLAWSADKMRGVLRGDAVRKSSCIHHREIPELLAGGAADVSLIYKHLALRYARIFPDLFEMLPMGHIAPAAASQTVDFSTVYAAGLVGNGGAFGAAFLRHLGSDGVTRIYEHHGLSRPASP